MENEIEKTSGAQANANEETKEAIAAARNGRGEFKKDAAERLDKIDARSRKLHQKLASADPGDKDDLPADARTRLSDVDRESMSLRADLQRLDTGTPQAIQDIQMGVERRLDAVEKTLDNLD